MRELKIFVKIDEIKDKIHILEEQVLGIPEGIDKEIYLQGIYHDLALKHNKNIENKTIFKIKENDKRN